jgi:hypothetical protein
MKTSRILKASTLVDLGACPKQVKLFRRLWGEQVRVTVPRMIKVADQFGWDWGARHLLTATATAWQAYDAATASARQAYQAARAPAWQAYQAATATAWQAYDAARATAGQAYDAAMAPAWQAYQAARATAFAAAYISDT